VEQEQGLFGPLDKPGGKAPTGVYVCSEDARLVRVAFDRAGDNLFDYALPEQLHTNLAVGQRIRAALGKGNRLEVGFCVEFPCETSVERVKYINEVVDQKPLIDDQMMQLAHWMAGYYCCPLGAVLSAMVPAAVKHQVGMVRRKYLRLTSRGKAYPQKTDDLRLSAQGRAIISFLNDRDLSANDLLPLNDLTEKLQCGKGPFDTLVRCGLIEIIQRFELARPHSNLAIPAEPQPSFGPNADQLQSLDQIKPLIDKDCFWAVLLHGVTGSGKTEVYIRCIEQVLQKGRQALVLVPEISLTPQTVSRFLARFRHVALLHSGLTDPQRHQQWRWIAQGGAEVVVGARSAVFAPLPNLGLIIVDEEHEPSYKQDSAPRYHGRDVAIKRAQMNNITVILGSATPSLESLYNCQTKAHFQLLKLPRRVLNLPLPKVAVVNMCTESLERKGRHLLSRLLEAQLHRCLDRKKQAILLLNRRGHSSYVFCPSCRFVLTCPNCDVNLTCHKTPAALASARRSWVMCHYCLHSSQIPKACPLCKNKLLLLGAGTQRAEEEIQRKLPQVRLRRMDSDSTKPGDMQEVLADFGAGRIDVLIGTQMIGKGLDFPNVTLVGVLNADTALSLPDFRSSERTFQLIEQVAGRCGRLCDDGRVVVQSFVPDEPAVKFACHHDYDSFSQYELNIRDRCRMPPFDRLARIILRDAKLEKLELAGKKLRQNIDLLNEQLQTAVQVRGPMPAGIARLENYHRQEIIIKNPAIGPIQTLLTELRRQYLTKLNVQAVVDVDPINLL